MMDLLFKSISSALLEDIRATAKAKSVKMEVEPCENKRFLIVDFGKVKPKRRIVIPQIYHFDDAYAWLNRVMASIRPRKPRKGVAIRKMQPSIKSKVLKSLTELKLTITPSEGRRQWRDFVNQPRRRTKAPTIVVW